MGHAPNPAHTRGNRREWQQTKGSIVAFMQPQVCRGAFFQVETTCGTESVPGMLIGRSADTPVSALLDYLEGKPLDPDEVIAVQHGWLARMSAPGYLDCTAWSAHATEAAALAELHEMFDCE